LSFSAQAKKWVYSPRVTEGEVETSYYIDAYRGASGKVSNSQELELEYGLSSRDKAAFYLVDGHRPGAVSEAAWKIEWIHDFSVQDSPNGIGLYVEYRQARNQVDTIEVKPLYETWFSERTVRMRLNAEFEREIGGGAESGTEVGYAASVALKRRPNLTPSLELYGTLGEVGSIRSVDEQSHLAGAAVDIELMEGLKWHMGGLFGLTSGSEDWRIKGQLSMEW